MFLFSLNLDTMENWIIYLIMSVSGLGALFSGFFFARRGGKVTMLVVCMIVFEMMLFMLGEREGWGLADGRTIGLVSGVVLAILGHQLWPVED